jgi:hypothetical protein
MLFSAVYCLSFVIGLPWGYVGVALAYTVAVYLLAVPGMQAAFRFAPVTLSSAAARVLRPAAVGLTIAAVGAAVRAFLATASPLGTIAACTTAAALAAALLIGIWPALREDVRKLGSLMAELRAGSSAHD